MPTITIPSESIEYIYLNVTRNGTTVTDGVQATITSGNDRPTPDSWNNTDVVDGKTALLITTQAPGRYRLWVKVSNGPERIVEAAGALIIT